jgi:hypothetical protein
MRRLLLILGFLLCLPGIASANPTVVNFLSYGCASGTCIGSFAGAPPNGNVVDCLTVSAATSGTPPTDVQDSNALQLTLETSVPGVGANVGTYEYAYTVSGTPGVGYSCVSNAGNSCIKGACINMSGVTLPGLARTAYSAAGVPSVTIPTQVGSVVWCGYGGSAAETLAISNASGVTVLNGAAQRTWAYGYATGVSSTCSASTNSSYTLIGVAYPGGSGTGTNCVAPYTYPCVFFPD